MAPNSFLPSSRKPLHRPQFYPIGHPVLSGHRMVVANAVASLCEISASARQNQLKLDEADGGASCIGQKGGSTE